MIRCQRKREEAYKAEKREKPQREEKVGSWLIFFLYLIFIQRMSFVPNIKYKTEYCLYWQEGQYCEKGTHCFFAHGPQELRTIQQNHWQIMTQHSDRSDSPPKPHNYKTIFCKFYAQGQCKLGDKCTYAHERREKRKKKMSHDIKSQSCPPQEQGWTEAQIKSYYDQLYYYQMYNINPSLYPYPESGFPNDLDQLPQNQHLHEPPFLAHFPQDMSISPEVKPDTATLKSEPEQFNTSKIQSPQVSPEAGSPQSGKTDSTTFKTSTQIDQFQRSTDFKISQ